MAGIKIPVEAQVDSADLSQSIDKFVQQFNKMGAAVAQANKVKFDPIDKATLDDLKKVEAQFESLRKISGALNRRMKDTGQAGAGFFDIDWGRMYSDPNAKAREMRKAFEYVTGHAFQGGAPATPSPSNQNQPQRRPPEPSPGAHWGGAGRRVVSSGLQAAGPAGGVADTALSAGMRGGLVAGLAGLLGGMVALGVGKAIGAVMGKVGDAQQELIQYDTLKRTLGDVNVGFGALKESLRASSDSIDLTFAEGQRLGMEFAKIANLAPDAHKTLADEIAIAGGFGRSFGLDPATSNAFFAQMRQFRITEDETGSRRMSLMIGEAIARSGAFSKADEVLQAIGNFAAQQTRLGLMSANVSGFGGMLSGMIQSGVPGLDPQGAAALLSRVNAAIAGGGAMGEASQNFMFMALGRRLGLNPIQTRILQEQGAFGTAAATFGEGSTYARFSQAFGGSTPGTSHMAQTMSLPLIMDHFRKVYEGKPDLMADAIANALGISISQAMELAMAEPAVLGETTARLKRLDPSFDLTRMSHTGIAALSRIQSGDRGVLEAQAASLRARTGGDALTAQELDRLNNAMAGGDEEVMRDVLTELTATREQERTDGEQTRDKLVGIDNTLQRTASVMVPLFTDMRAGILFMAGRGRQGPMGIKLAMAEVEADERKQAINADYEARIKSAGQAALDARAEHQAAWESARQRMPGMTPEEQEAEREKLRVLLEARRRAEMRPHEIVAERSAAMAAEDARLKAEQDKIRSDYAASIAAGNAADTPATGPASSPSAGGAGRTPATGALDKEWLLEHLAETDRMLGLPPGTSAAQIDQESSFNPNAVSRAGAMGLAQVMPSTLRSLEKRWGRRIDPFDPMEAVRIHRELMGENLGHFGNVDDALRAYNGGWYRGRWNNPETRGYVQAIHAKRDMYDDPIPAGVRGSDSATTPVALNVNVTGNLKGDKGEDKGVIEAATIKKTISVPVPYGAQQ